MPFQTSEKFPNIQEFNQSLPKNQRLPSRLSNRTKIFLKMIFWQFKRNWLVILIWFLAFILRILAAFFSKGYTHPDEHYQSIEIVYNEIFNYGLIPWEFIDGARSWVFPFIVLTIFKIEMAFGVMNIEHLLIGVRLFTGIISMISVVVAYFFAKKIFGEKVALFATGFIAFWYDFIFWSTRTMTDGLAMNFTFLATYLIYNCCNSVNQDSLAKRNSKIERNPNAILGKNTKKGLWESSLAGFFIGFSYMLKFPVAIIAIPIVLWLLYHKRWFYILTFSGTAVLMVLLQGVIDLFTWGSFLHSSLVFIDYNIISGQSAHHGASPFYAYIALIASRFMAYTPFFLLFILLGIQKNKKNVYLLGTALFFLIVFSFISHKEYRFVFPVIPYLVMIAANGAVKFPKFIKKEQLQKGVYVGLIVITLTCSAVTGIYTKNFQPQKSYCDAYMWVGEQNDFERVFIVDYTPYATPGFAYLQKNINYTWAPGYLLVDRFYQHSSERIYFIVPKDYMQIYSEINNTFSTYGISLVKVFKTNATDNDPLIFVYYHFPNN
ncbi:MAG: hypothetical protein GF308_18005 [Candidatus Heimdallarchaeota archaeon]|nr:hypothetical protein [Candidatus Heimdallarchaeota archaeon]